MGNLDEHRCTFVTISGSVLLRMRNVSDSSCRENQHTHFMFHNVFFFKNHALYEVMLKIVVQLDRPEMKKGAFTLHAG
jgi:hypothetical protein